MPNKDELLDGLAIEFAEICKRQTDNIYGDKATREQCLEVALSVLTNMVLELIVEGRESKCCCKK